MIRNNLIRSDTAAVDPTEARNDILGCIGRSDRSAQPDVAVQQQGGRERQDGSESRHARPVCYNGWFGLELLNVPLSSSPTVRVLPPD
jgi:hypothetical protein